MKLLLVLMILLSLFVGVSINGVWSSLYNYEFPSVIEMVKAGSFTAFETTIWIMLLITHFSVLCLPFLTNQKYFKGLLTISPLSFIVFFMISNLLLSILLIPFIIVWVIALVKQNKLEAKKA